MSALAHIVGQLGELSESELRQLYLMVGVRLGIPDVPSGVKPQKEGRSKTSAPRASVSQKSGKQKKSSKGNPQRKSQWANHPLYIEYSRLKKVVETQAKEQRCSFNAVNTAESRAYQQAFIQWMEAKSSFRDRRKDGQEGGAKRQEEEEDSSSEEEGEAETGPSTSAGRNRPAPQPSPPAPVKPGSSGKTTAGNPNIVGKGKAPAA